MVKTYNTKLGKWIALIRLQSTPVTVVPLLLGYITVTQTLHRDILPLIIVGALGHWGFYALNDVYDVEVDSQQGKEMKPLVDRDISYRRAEFASYGLIGMSLFGAVIWFNTFAASAYSIACVFGWYYNLYSSRRTFSSIVLGMWGVFIVLTGAAYASGWNTYTVYLSILFGVHMVWMTLIGDLKDIENDEKNIPHLYDVRIETIRLLDNHKSPAEMLHKPLGFQFKVVVPLILIQIALSLSILWKGIMDHGMQLNHLYAGWFIFPLSFFFIFQGMKIGSGIPYSEKKTTRDVVFNEIIAVTIILVPLGIALGPYVILAMLFASFIWGLSILRVQFGSFTRFP